MLGKIIKKILKKFNFVREKKEEKPKLTRAEKRRIWKETWKNIKNT